MPIFEYICKNCERPFERIVPRHDSVTDCPHCSSDKVEKQLSVFAVSSNGGNAEAFSDAGCGRCGAAQPGMCGMPD
jgi:putative FmdB family regulatory protein